MAWHPIPALDLVDGTLQLDLASQLVEPPTDVAFQVEVDAPVVAAVRPYHSDNLYHWLVETVPKLLLLRQQRLHL